MKSSVLFSFLLTSVFSVGTANAAISWGEAITAGNTTLKASHINEIRTQIQNLRNDVNAGSAGAWTNGTGGIIYYNGGNIGIGTTIPRSALDVYGPGSYISVGLDGGLPAMKLGESSNVSTGSDIWFERQGLISAQDNLFLNIDSGNASTAKRFAIGKDSESSTASTELFRVQENGNVGIGTTTPSYKLDVAGDIIMSTGRSLRFGTADQRLFGNDGSAFYADSNHSTITQMIFRDKEDAVYGRVYGAANGTDFGLVDGDGDWGIRMIKDTNTQFLINNSEKMRILASGNVGIGTTSPTSKLHVNGGTNVDVTSSGDFSVSDTSKGSVSNVIWYERSTGRTYLGNMGGSGVNPEVEVRGDLNVTGALTATSFTGSGASLTALNASNIASGTLNLARITNNSIGANKLAANSVGLSELSATGTTNTTTFLRGDNTWAVVPSGADNLGNHNATTTLNMNDQEIQNARAIQGKDWDDNTGGADNKYRLLFRDGANMFYDGGVVVGQYGNGTWTDVGSGDLVVQNQAAIGTTINTGNLASGAAISIGDSDTGLKQMGDGQLAVFTNNAEKMRIIANGNVGIGKTAPAEKLEVAGSIRATGAYPKFRLQETDGTANQNYQLSLINGDLRFQTNNDVFNSASSVMVLNTVGNVGIGTTTPGQKLSVAGTFGVSESGGNGGRLLLSSSAAGAVINQNDNSPITFQSQGVEKMRIRSNGNVGIGTNNPLFNLDVAGSMQAISSTSNAMSFKEYAVNSVNGPSIQTPSGNTLSIRPYGSGPTTINGTGPGKVGVGTNDPTEKLDVLGGNIQVGNASGAVAMTINDGGGNANITFNHTGRVPDITGNAGRIAVNVDSTTGANMSFQLADGLTAGTVANTSEVFRVDADGKVRAQQYCDENGNNCGDASAGQGVQIGDTVTPASTTCSSTTLLPNKITIYNGKYAIAYAANGNCNLGNYLRYYTGAWSACTTVGGGGCRCFVAGTKVHMADGTFKDIETVVVGDRVLNEKMEATIVTALHKPIIGARGIFTINHKIKSTGDHPFKTTKGWKVVNADQFAFTQNSDDPYQSFKDVDLEELAIGDVLITAEGEEAIDSITWSGERPQDEFVYSFSIAEGEGYWADGYLVKDLK